MCYRWQDSKKRWMQEMQVGRGAGQCVAGASSSPVASAIPECQRLAMKHTGNGSYHIQCEFLHSFSL